MPNETSPTILVSPERGLLDSGLHVELQGFAPRSLVTVRSTVQTAAGVTWSTHAVYVANQHGQVDLDRDNPVFGDFRVPDSEALIWSLRPVEQSATHWGQTHYLSSDLRDYELQITAEVGEQVLARAVAIRQPVADGVQRIEVRENGLYGTLFLPAVDSVDSVAVGAVDAPERHAPFVPILVVPGSNGGVPESVSALYASHGYAAFALAYFKAPEPGYVPPTLRDIPLEYFETAIDFIKQHPLLHEDKLVVTGGSRGGELSLLLSSFFPEDFAATIAWVPSNYINGGMPVQDALPEDADWGKPAWTYGGEPLPHVPWPYRGNEPLELRDGFVVRALGSIRRHIDREAYRHAEIPVEKIQGPILFLSGADDVLWPSSTYTKWAIERLQEHNFAYPIEFYDYPGVGHSLAPNGNPATVLQLGLVRSDGQYEGVPPMHIGGTPQAVAAARQDLWPRVLNFLSRHREGSLVANSGEEAA